MTCTTHKSRPMAGPFGSTSDTTTAVSPLSGLGLSLPPEMAKPNPNLGSCNEKNMTGEKMRVRGSACGRFGAEIEAEGAHSCSVPSELGQCTEGCVPVNSCWSLGTAIPAWAVSFGYPSGKLSCHVMVARGVSSSFHSRLIKSNQTRRFSPGLHLP